MKAAVRLVALGVLISACFAGTATAQYIKILSDNPTDNTKMRATGTTILTIILDSSHDKNGSPQTCNSHTSPPATCGAAPDTRPLDVGSYTILLARTGGGTVTWGTFTPADAAYTPFGGQKTTDHDCSIDFQRTFGTFTPAGLFTIGSIPVTILSGSPGVEVANHPIDADPNLPTTFVGTPNCDGFVLGFNSYLLGDPNVACSGDWYDRDGVSGPTGGNAFPDITAPATASAAEGTAMTPIMATATDADATNTLTITQSGKPADLTFTSTPGVSPRTATISGTPGFSDAGSYNILWRVSDGAGGTDSTNTVLTIANTNQAPTLSQPANMTVNEGVTADQAITGTDPDGDALTFTKTAGPTYVTVTTTNATTGSIHLMPGFSDAGTAAATVRASDGSLNSDKTLTVTVNNVNRPPTLGTITNMTVTEGGTADQALTGFDPDGTALTFTKATGPAFMTVTTTNATTGSVHLAPASGDAAGSPYSASASASDGSLSDTKSFSITVNAGVPQNRAPTLNAIANMTVAQAGTADQVITGSDADGNALTFAKSAGPTFVTVTTTNPTTGNVHAAPGFGDAAGPYPVTVTATDNGTPALSDSKSFTVTVTAGANRAPTLNAIANMTVDEGATANQVITGSDPDGDALTFAKGAGPAYMTVTTTNATSGSIHLAPGFSDSGTAAATVTATDNGSPPLSDSKSFTITVNNVNRGPSLNAVANMTVTEGGTADQIITGSDPDGDALTFTKATGPAFMTVTTTNATTGSVHVAPGTGDAVGSPYSASASASDGSLSDTKSFSITVNAAAPGNRAPTLNAIANMTVDEGATADQVITGSDPDGDALTFTKAAGPGYVTVTTTNATTGSIHLAPGFSDSGTAAATVRASDGALSDEKSFTITVSNVN
ncbi:MAG: hypothetical protein E6K76_00705, partial [Candidatus Eisenbacteria bacterium]